MYYSPNKFYFTEYKNVFKIYKKEFHKSKQPIDLNLVEDTNKIVLSDKFKQTVDGFKYFIGCQEGNVRPLCIIFPQMIGSIKFFENGGKNVFYDYSVLVKYNEIWNKI